MAQGKKSREKKNVNDLEKGEQIVYKTKDGEEIPCLVLYDKAYNEEKGTDYGIQVIPSKPICTVLLGCDDPELPSSMNSKDAWERGTWSYNNAINNLNNKAELYRNPQYTNEGGARCLGTVPNNPSAENGNQTDLNRIQELAKEGLIQTDEDIEVWYVQKEHWFQNYGWDDHNSLYSLKISGNAVTFIRRSLADRDSTKTYGVYNEIWPKNHEFGFIPIFKLDNITQVELLK